MQTHTVIFYALLETSNTQNYKDTNYAYLFNTTAFVLEVKDFMSLSASTVQQGGSRET